MARLSSFLVSALLVISTVFGIEMPQLSTPTTHLVLHDKLYTTIHSNVQRMRGVYFSGKVVGKFEKTDGHGWYNGQFRGSTKGKKTKADFKFSVRGRYKSMGFNVKYGGNVDGQMSVHGQKVAVQANYHTKAHGTLYGKGVKGSSKGKAYFTAAYGKFYYYEHGHFRMYIGGTSLQAKYYVILNKKSIDVAVYGKYGGKKFFVKYSFSLNLLPLGLDMDSMTIKRNYGTVYLTVGNKKYTEKYDVKGMEIPKLV